MTLYTPATMSFHLELQISGHHLHNLPVSIANVDIFPVSFHQRTLPLIPLPLHPPFPGYSKTKYQEHMKCLNSQRLNGCVPWLVQSSQVCNVNLVNFPFVWCRMILNSKIESILILLFFHTAECFVVTPNKV